MFRLTFLGTSSGIPTSTRNVAGLAVECVKQNLDSKQHPWVLIDCGEGTQHQILKSHLSFKNLKAIFITHVHGDHCYGLSGLLASLGMQGRKETLILVAPKAIVKLLDTLSLVTELHFSYPIEFVAIEDLIGHQQATYHLIFGADHKIIINIAELSHRCPSYGFALTQIISKHHLAIERLEAFDIDKRHWNVIFRHKDDETMVCDGVKITPKDFVEGVQTALKIVVAGDNDMPALLAPLLCEAKVLVHEATYTETVRQKILQKPLELGGFDPKHSSAKMVAEFANQAGIPHLVLTHFSARYALFEDELSSNLNMGHIRAETRQYYQGDVILARDFMQIIIDNHQVVAHQA